MPPHRGLQMATNEWSERRNALPQCWASAESWEHMRRAVRRDIPVNDQHLATTVAAMKPDIATRLASTVVAGVSIDDADTIIREFLVQISRCPACDDTGT